MQTITTILTMAPSIVNIAQAGEKVWGDFISTLQAHSTEEDNAKLETMKSEDVRRQIIAESEASA